MDYSYKAIVDRVRDDSMEYTGLNWLLSDNPVTKYPNLVAWIDAHQCECGFDKVCRYASITPATLMSVIVEGVELTDMQLKAVSKAVDWSVEMLKEETLTEMEPEFLPHLLARRYEDCVHACDWFSMAWVKEVKAVSVYYDLKQGIRVPVIYWDFLNYAISRNIRYRTT